MRGWSGQGCCEGKREKHEEIERGGKREGKEKEGAPDRDGESDREIE